MNTAIVGGGLAGLTAALYLSRCGHRVTLYERRVLGGRAHTRHHDGFSFNLGPHALYRGGHAEAVLTELGVAFAGQNPVLAKADRIAWVAGKSHLLPTHPLSMLKTDLMSLPDKIAFTAIASTLARKSAAAWRGRSAAAWVASTTPRPRVQALLHALIRLSSYVDHPDDFDAEVALQQLGASMGPGVVYVDGGWGSLVDGLRAQAQSIRFVNECKVEGVTSTSDGVGLRCSDGAHTFDAVVVAVGASAAGKLLDRTFAVTPLRAASLTVALRSERSRRESPLGPCTFAMGIDEPLYYSAHHDAAALAPHGGQLVHALRYLKPGQQHDGVAHRVELDQLMDAMQPGWREEVVHEAYQPHLTVTWDVPLASRGGLAGRTPVTTDDPRIVLAGDWIGDEGHLADAAFASGKRAAERLAARAVEAA